MPFARLSQRTNLWMRKVNTWVSEEELEAINKVKGDVSVSLWIRRAIRNALSAEEGRGATNSNRPSQAASYATVRTTTTTTTTPHQASNSEKEVVEVS
jgi:hypothetical protein